VENSIRKCFYCERSVKRFSKEHVLPSFLGCDQTVNNYMCIDCNSRFGQGIDADFATQVNWVRVFFALKDARGKLPPPLYRLKCVDGNFYDLLPGGKPMLSRPEIIQTAESGGTKVTAKYRSWDEAKRHLPKLLSKSKDGLELEKGHEYLGFLQISFAIGGEPAFRSFGKSILNLIALSNENLLQLPELYDLRDYAYYGTGRATDWFSHDLLNPSLVTPPSRLLDNALIISHKKEDSVLKANLQIFGQFRYICEIPFASNIGESFCIVLRNDPFSHERSITSTDPIQMVSLSKCKDLWTTNDRFAPMQEKVNHLMKTYMQVSSEIKIKDIINTSLQRALGEPNDEPITREQLDKLIYGVSEAFVLWANKIGDSQKYSVSSQEEANEIFKKQ